MYKKGNGDVFMLAVYSGCLIAGLVFLSLFLKFRVQKSTAKAAVVKAVTSVFFILTAVFATLNVYDKLSFDKLLSAGLIVGGLVCGLLGDIWLDLKFVYRADERFFTYTGFLSFAAGHFFYIAAVICGINGKISLWAVLCSLALAVVSALVIFFGEKAMQLRYGEYKLISTLYGALLFFMTAFCGFNAFFSGVAENKHLLVMAIGGVFFIISDLILSGTYFGEGKNRPVDIITNHATYYLAQFIIASAILFI